jgi:hypothetical protein
MSKSDGGKGDMPRPFSVPLEIFDDNFEAIFSKKTTKHQPHIEPIPFAGMVDTGEDDGLGTNSN